MFRLFCRMCISGFLVFAIICSSAKVLSQNSTLITPVLPGDSGCDLSYWPTSGRVVHVSLTSIKIDQPAITFLPNPLSLRASDALSKGESGNVLPSIEHMSYRLKDVKVGDEVVIIFKRVKGDYICTQISIQRRPNGRVPPSPLAISAANPWHEQANAFQDSEILKIPLPEKYRKSPTLTPALWQAKKQAILASQQTFLHELKEQCQE